MRAAWESVIMLNLSNGMVAAANLANVIDETLTTLQYGRKRPRH